MVTEGHLGWADIIFCMEKSYVNRPQRKFRGSSKQVVCLHIPNEFELMDPDLIEKFRAKLPAYVTLPEESRITHLINRKECAEQWRTAGKARRRNIAAVLCD